MNNFTKEELICIKENIVVPDNHKDKSILLKAYHKLLGLIDNYDAETIMVRGEKRDLSEFDNE